MEKDKPTKKLEAEELEKRAAPMGLMYTDPTSDPTTSPTDQPVTKTHGNPHGGPKDPKGFVQKG